MKEPSSPLSKYPVELRTEIFKATKDSKFNKDAAKPYRWTKSEETRLNEFADAHGKPHAAQQDLSKHSDLATIYRVLQDDLMRTYDSINTRRVASKRCSLSSWLCTQKRGGRYYQLNPSKPGRPKKGNAEAFVAGVLQV